MQAALGTIASAAGCSCLRVFQQHNERVRRTVPAERLLVFRMQQGWEPRCRFLGVEVPDEPSPG